MTKKIIIIIIFRRTFSKKKSTGQRVEDLHIIRVQGLRGRSRAREIFGISNFGRKKSNPRHQGDYNNIFKL